MIYNNVSEIIGRTPIIKLTNLKEDGEADILVKPEFLNPSSSIKDRAALFMINAAEKEGLLNKGDTIIEPTSGNTGIGLAMIGAARGYRVILVMPETMSMERQKLIKAYGAEIILTSGPGGMAESVDQAEKLAKDKGYFLPNQFANMSNKLAHYETTAEEILETTEDKLHAFIAGVGTGGTLIGTGERLKEVLEDISIIAIEPSSSKVLSGEDGSSHKIQGIGANFIPDIYDEEIIDEIMSISDEEAYRYARLLGEKEGILAGISSGANVAGAKRIARRLGEGKRVVTVLPDTGERYLSTDLYMEE